MKYFGSNIAQLFQNTNKIFEIFPTITVQTVSDDRNNCTIIVLSSKLSQ